jgi:hypothetical protein
MDNLTDNWGDFEPIDIVKNHVKSQDTFPMGDGYVEQSGVKFASVGSLLMPAPGESEKYAKANPELAEVVGSKPVIFVPGEHRGHRFAKDRNDFRKVKMNGLDALRLRQRGA